ncbi:MAG: phytanoyl-CoA dioxygenase family protein [bacterium]
MIRQAYPITSVNDAASEQAIADRLFTELDREGIVVLPNLFSAEQLRSMQRAFDVKLRRMRWNNFDGYQRTELYRHMVEDVLLLDQGFVDLALHPLVKQILNRYLGNSYELNEAKGWKSLATKRDFHGWHADAWYDQESVQGIPREVKLALYLTDVRSGTFNYIKGSHRKQHPRPVKNSEVKDVPASQVAELKGSAGTAFLFDTSGIHRQGVPMLESRRAIFYNYHDPDVALQKEDIDYYRYHPLLLNAAFLGNLSAENQRILGFGNMTNYTHAFERAPKHTLLQTTSRLALEAVIRANTFRDRVAARLKSLRSLQDRKPKG